MEERDRLYGNCSEEEDDGEVDQDGVQRPHESAEFHDWSVIGLTIGSGKCRQTDTEGFDFFSYARV